MIELIDICKSYDAPVLTGFSAMFGDGVSAIMGASGSGKTTLLRILAGLEAPDRGEVRGVLSKRLAIVFQEDRLLPWASALDNVRFVLERSKWSEAKCVLEAVGLEQSMNKRALELSGGMKRRVAIARALAADSDILLLDEPFKGLDEGTRQMVIGHIAESARNKPTILITHDAAEAKLLGGRVYSLD